jgi:hypothetical protein
VELVLSDFFGVESEAAAADVDDPESVEAGVADVVEPRLSLR